MEIDISEVMGRGHGRSDLLGRVTRAAGRSVWTWGACHMPRCSRKALPTAIVTLLSVHSCKPNKLQFSVMTELQPQKMAGDSLSLHFPTPLEVLLRRREKHNHSDRETGSQAS